VHHVLFELTTPRGGKGAAGEEAEIVRRVEAMTVPACERESWILGGP
jgi:hypothetical protein